MDKEKVEVPVCFTLVHVHRTRITCSCTPARSPELRARAQPGMHYTFSVYKLCEKKKFQGRAKKHGRSGDPKQGINSRWPCRNATHCGEVETEMIC